MELSDITEGGQLLTEIDAYTRFSGTDLRPFLNLTYRMKKYPMVCFTSSGNDIAIYFVVNKLPNRDTTLGIAIEWQDQQIWRGTFPSIEEGIPMLRVTLEQLSEDASRMRLVFLDRRGREQ